MEYITSRKNPLLLQVRKLTSGGAGARRAAGLYLGEGLKLLREALLWSAPVTAVLSTPHTVLPPLPPEVRQVQIPSDVMKTISPSASPQGVLFLLSLPQPSPPQLRPDAHYLVLDGIQDPGNVGTIWRTADAFGLRGLLLLHHCADPYGYKTVRASMGACFRLPLWEITLEDLKKLIHQTQLPLYAASLEEGAMDVRHCALSSGLFVIGSEGQGISPELLALSPRHLTIPMKSTCESLNAAVAASILLWEIGRTQHLIGSGNPSS